MSHFYLPGNWQSSQVIAPESLRHHLRVRRIRSGESIAVFNGVGMVGQASIDQSSTDKHMLLNITGIKEDLSREASYPITLAQGLTANDKMDWIIEKAVELGVKTIVPVQTQRSVTRLDSNDLKKAQKKQDHWSQIVIAACEQCDRSVLPTMQAPITLTQLVQNTQTSIGSAQAQSSLPIVLSPTGQVKLISILKRAPGQGVTLLIGPEGGLSDEELNLLENNDWILASMGQRILRTETAGISAIAAVHTIWGGF